MEALYKGFIGGRPFTTDLFEGRLLQRIYLREASLYKRYIGGMPSTKDLFEGGLHGRPLSSLSLSLTTHPSHDRWGPGRQGPDGKPKVDRYDQMSKKT